ncbi:hypothetical protein FPANT_3575 [Fusarium pseudoanthophilum]|uniref:Uncharacterized protein n=1 Tax=Fusarium pseudoanthophilum TaxID=48495 RepID=A0A8H5PM37_9HYPO|nr:hypothetical protein FPANT_3575 [Fusarium pseudoanthophilum]
MDIDVFSSIIWRAPPRNDRLTKDIIKIARQPGATTEEIKKLLKQVYDAISRLCEALSSGSNDGLFQIPEKVILDAWHSFFKPIQALRQLPSCGEFVAARLLLFTGWAFYQETGLKLSYKEDTFVEETKPLYAFLVDLDDALLESLKKMWDLSQSRERFDWVFTDFIVTDIDEIPEALALSPQELKDLNGIQGRTHYYLDPDESDDSDDSDESEEYIPYTGPTPRWDCGEQDWDDFEWIRKGSDGAIARWLEFKFENAAGQFITHGIHVFRRSRQFCRDARQKSEAHIGRQQHQTFDEVTHHRLPPEMRNRILEHVEYRDPFPYLEKLDLAEAYVPFPKVGEHCTQCDNTEGESASKQTCPQKAIHVWNLALRRFHTFHRNGCQQWSLCTRHDCTGHHDDEEEWQVTGEPEFTRYLESLAARGNDEFVSLDQVGLGPMNPIRIDVQADSDRWDALFRGYGIYRESSEDAKMIGGLGGLKDAMIHGRTLISVWEGDGGGSTSNDDDSTSSDDDDDSTSNDGARAWDPTWQYGRNLYDEKVAKVVIKGLHSEDDCESCVELVRELRDFPFISI